MKEHMTNPSILAVGFAKWYGCDPRALAVSIRKLGFLMVEIDAEDYIPWRWSGFIPKLCRRILLYWFVRDYNREILRRASSSNFDFILIFKGLYVTSKTIKRLRNYKKPIYNFYPDLSYCDHGEDIPQCLPYYDCVFTTKVSHGEKEMHSYNIRKLVHVRHGFDPDVHRPVKLNASQLQHYGCDVSFVGCWSPEKEKILSTILFKRPKIKLIVYGIGWNYASREFISRLGSNLREGVFGDELTIVYSASCINLGLLSRSRSDAMVADQSTVRSFQIPASKAFMIHEDTPEIRMYFNEGSEVMLFRDAEDLLLKIDIALNSSELREKLINASYKKVTSWPYDYSEAAKKIIDHYRKG